MAALLLDHRTLGPFLAVFLHPEIVLWFRFRNGSQGGHGIGRNFDLWPTAERWRFEFLWGFAAVARVCRRFITIEQVLLLGRWWRWGLWWSTAWHSSGGKDLHGHSSHGGHRRGRGWLHIGLEGREVELGAGLKHFDGRDC